MLDAGDCALLMKIGAKRPLLHRLVHENRALDVEAGEAAAGMTIRFF